MARDTPMTAAEHLLVSKTVAANQRRHDAKKARDAQAAYKKVLAQTGDEARAAKVRASLSGHKQTLSKMEVSAAKRTQGLALAAQTAIPDKRAQIQASGISNLPGLHDTGGKIVGRAGEIIVNSPKSLIQMGSAVPLDLLAAQLAAANKAGLHKGNLLGLKPSFVPERTHEIVKAQAQSMATSARHPLRSPVDTALNASFAASLGASGVLRGAAAREAAATASAGGASKAAAARSAVTRHPLEGGGLLRRPAPTTRVLKFGDLKGQGLYSRAPLRQMVQKAADKRIVAKAAKGDVGPLSKKVGQFSSRTRAIDEAVNAAKRTTLQRRGKKLTTPQQVALRAYLENTPVADRLALAKSELAKQPTGAAAKRLQREVGLLSAADRYLGTNAKGDVTISKEFAAPGRRLGKGAGAEQLRGVAARSLGVARVRERQAVEHGLLPEAGLQARRDAPARVVAGAQFVSKRNAEKAATGFEKAGARSERQVVRAATKEAKAFRKQASSLADTEASARAQSFRAATTRSAEERAALVAERQARVSPAEAAASTAAETASLERGRIAKNVSYHETALAKAQHDLLDAQTHPKGRAASKIVQLTRAVSEQTDALKVARTLDKRARRESVMIAREQRVAGVAGEAPRQETSAAVRAAEVAQEGKARAEAVRAETANAQKRQAVARAAAAEKAGASGAEQARLNAAANVATARAASNKLVGGATERQGRAYVTYGNRAQRGAIGRAFISRTGAVPNKGPELTSSLKSFTGANLRTADYPHNTVQAIARSGQAMERYSEAVRLHQRLVSAGVRNRPQDSVLTKWVPVRTRLLSPSENEALRKLTQQQVQGLELTKAERLVYQREIQKYEKIESAPEGVGTAVGAAQDGVVWVPDHIFKRLSETGRPTVPVSPHWQVRGAQHFGREFTAVMRSLALYTTGGGVGYIPPNVLANWVLIGLQQGPRFVTITGRQMVAHPRFYADMGKDAVDRMDAALGEGGAVATFAEPSTSRLAGAATAAQKLRPVNIARAQARTLGRVTDVPTRRISFRFEAARAGFDTPAKVADLVTNPKHAEAFTDVTLRARDAALDYELMSPLERSTVARVFFIWAYLRAASRYTLNFPLDHPYTAAVMASLSKQAAANDQLGPRPQYLESATKIGTETIPGVGEIPFVTNLNPINNLSAPLDIARIVASSLGKGQQRENEPIDATNPAIRTTLEALFGRNAYTSAKIPGGFFHRLITSVKGQAPLARDIKAWQAANNPDKLATMLRPRSHRDILLRQALGSIAPSPFNPKVAEEQARADYLAGLPADKRAYKRVFTERNALFAEAKKATGTKTLPAEMKQAYNRYAERSAIRARMIGKKPPGSLSRAKARASADLYALDNWGVITHNERLYLTKLVHRSSTHAEVDEMAHAIDAKMDDAYRGTITDIRRAAKQQNVDLPHATLPG